MSENHYGDRSWNYKMTKRQCWGHLLKSISAHQQLICGVGFRAVKIEESKVIRQTPALSDRGTDDYYTIHTHGQGEYGARMPQTAAVNTLRTNTDILSRDLSVLLSSLSSTIRAMLK